MPRLTLPAASALTLLGLTLAACGSDGGSVPSATSPTVISVSPANGAKGVKADAKIVVTFSKAMDQAATQAAYQSSDLPAAAVTFAWNTDGTVLSITPNTPLAYAQGSSFSAPAKSYAFTIDGKARDTSGHGLGATTSGFSTLKNITAVLPSVPALDGMEYRYGSAFSNLMDASVILVGDGNTNGGIVGLLTFDLSAIPADPSLALTTATLSLRKNGMSGSPYTALNPCVPTKTSPCASL